MSAKGNSPTRIALRGFKPGGIGVGSVLGALETTVMEALWSAPGQTVSEVEALIQRRRPIAHTTVLTTLDRLHRKGYLARDRQGKAYVYTPRFTREQFERAMAEEVLGALLAHFSAPAMSAFVDLVGNDPKTLDRLEAIIRAKRRERRET
ncbi:MAG: BlaI/MecI/CopY family transcriptional regulator [Candidatus Rokuibacteriota bacterium]